MKKAKLNKAGIEQLKADLRAKPKRYNQDSFGKITACGTEMCMAGHCLARKLGLRRFNAKLKKGEINGRFDQQSIDAGIKQLGIRKYCFPQIFRPPQEWPFDISNRYSYAENNHDHKAMVEVACEALDRLEIDGSIGPAKATKNA